MKQSQQGLKKELQSIMGKTVEYQAVSYVFSTWEEFGEKIIIATDSKPITIDSENLGTFLSGIIVKESASSVLTIHRPVKLETLDRVTQIGLVDAMKMMIAEIQVAQGKEEVDTVSKKESAMTNSVRVITEIARLELDLYKASKGK